MTPAVAVCTACAKEFKVSVHELRQVSAAQQSLQKQFSEHACGTTSDKT